MHDLCECVHENKELSDLVKSHMPSDDEIYELAELYKLFADPTRLKIMMALNDRELCVCDISDILGMSQSAISHQLRVLKQGRLVKFRKEGKAAYYSLDDNHIHEIISCGKEHIEE